MEQQTKPKSQGKAKKKTDNRRGFNLKFTTAYWLMLEEMKKQCGFRSTYEMLITIIQCFVRYVAKRREQIWMEGEPRDGVISEIEEMFADLEDSEPTPASRRQPTPRGQSPGTNQASAICTGVKTMAAPRTTARILTKRTTTRMKAARTPTKIFLTMAKTGAGLFFRRGTCG